MPAIYLNSDVPFGLHSSREFDATDVQLQVIWQRPTATYQARAAEPLLAEQSQEARFAAYLSCVADGLHLQDPAQQPPHVDDLIKAFADRMRESDLVAQQEATEPGLSEYNPETDDLGYLGGDNPA